MGGSFNFQRTQQSKRLSSSKAVRAQGRAEKRTPEANSSHRPELSPDTHSHSGLIRVVEYYTETSCATTHILIGSTFNNHHRTGACTQKMPSRITQEFSSLRGNWKHPQKHLDLYSLLFPRGSRPIVHNAKTANINFIFCVSVQRPPLSPSVSSQLSSFPTLPSFVNGPLQIMI